MLLAYLYTSSMATCYSIIKKSRHHRQYVTHAGVNNNKAWL